jgi:hypothetical protein
MAKVIIEISEELKRKAKVKLARQGKSMKVVLTNLLEEWVKTNA